MWIEIVIPCLPQAGFKVTPYAGVWIEIGHHQHWFFLRQVTPYAGVWIEIVFTFPRLMEAGVTPYAGVWIEIRSGNSLDSGIITSLPTRECGLK